MADPIQRLAVALSAVVHADRLAELHQSLIVDYTTPDDSGERVPDPDAPAAIDDLLAALHIAGSLARPNAWLVWSVDARMWWKPNGAGYTDDVWRAGRFTESEARSACAARTWPADAPLPPEVAIPAPENGGGLFTIDDLARLPDRLAWQVEQASHRMAEKRAVARQAVTDRV